MAARVPARVRARVMIVVRVTVRVKMSLARARLAMVRAAAVMGGHGEGWPIQGLTRARVRMRG